jgi:phospholipid/cholesterol/gamma-HCH transport system substrate-binding protein
LKLSREVKTGIFAIVSILLFIFGYNYLKGTDLLTKSKFFYVTYQNVGGLENAAPVTVNGFKVGKVLDIGFAPSGDKLVVKFSVDKDFTFSKNSTVKLINSGLLGGKALAIIPSLDKKPVAKSGDMLHGEVEQGMLESMTTGLKPMEQKINKVMDNLDSLLVNLNHVLDSSSQKNLKQAIVGLNQTIYSFKNTTGQLNSMLTENKSKIASTLTNLETTSSNFATLSDSLATIKVKPMLQNLENTISKFNAMATKIESGEGSVGKLLKDEKLYDNLSGASKQLEQLLEDMKLHPKRYVHFSLFGKKDKGYKESNTN